MGRGGTGNKGKAGGKGAGGKSGKDTFQKPTDDPNFFKWREGMRLEGTSKPNVLGYIVEAFQASGTFGRVFRCRIDADDATPAKVRKRRREQSVANSGDAILKGRAIVAAKLMRKKDRHLQYISDAQKEGQVLRDLEEQQLANNGDGVVATMRCLDSFATCDLDGEPYWCLILEWMDASLFDVVRANRGGLPAATVCEITRQLLAQLKCLHAMSCTHTDIKHKNCCLVSSAHRWSSGRGRSSAQLVLLDPQVKLIDYGNATFEHEEKIHPIHTKQFRAPEVLLKSSDGWGPASDIWTLGITVAHLSCGQLLFNSHNNDQLLELMADALGPFPAELMAKSQDSWSRQVVEKANKWAGEPALAAWLGLSSGVSPDAPEALLLDLLLRMLALDPTQRITAKKALRHKFFKASISLPDVPADAQIYLLDGGSSSVE